MAKRVLNPQIGAAATLNQGTQVVSSNQGIEQRLQEQMSRTPERNKWVDGAFEGGVTLGAAYVGSLNVLEQSGIWFKRVVGNSAGGIIAGLIAVGYSATEIQWLTSNFPSRTARPRTLPPNVNPINFMDFLDIPNPNSISNQVIEQTLEWKIIKGDFIDEFLKSDIPVPTRSSLADGAVLACKNTLPGGHAIITGDLEKELKSLFEKTTFSMFPVSAPKISDFIPNLSDVKRKNFAHQVCGKLLTINPIFLMMTQLLHGGSFFKGDRFIELYGELLKAKRNQLRGTGLPSPVTFSQLLIPLTVVATNYKTRKMEIYSRNNSSENISVVEAIRRSMSLPLIFEPRGADRSIIDGGLVSNFPIWLLHKSCDQYWPIESIDHSVPKIGFSLTDSEAAPTRWNCAPSKFTPVGTPPAVAMDDVLFQMIPDALRIQLFGSILGSPAARARIARELGTNKLMEVLANSFSMDKEKVMKANMSKALMHEHIFYHVNIPLLGFSGFDFLLNSDESHLNSIAQRGFHATLDALSQAPMVGTGEPLIPIRRAVRMVF